MTETPCIGICSTIYGDKVCRGCFRHYQDVINWNTFNDPEKITVLNQLEILTHQVLEQKIDLIDPALLQQKCRDYKIRIRLNWTPYTWAHALLREGMNKIKNPENYGFRIKPAFQNLSIAKLIEIIDDEIFNNATRHVPHCSI